MPLRLDWIRKNKASWLRDKDSPYVNVVVARQDNKNSQKVKNFVKAYQSPEVEKKAKENFLKEEL